MPSSISTSGTADPVDTAGVEPQSRRVFESMLAVHDGAFHHFSHEQHHSITDFRAISGKKFGSKRHISLKTRFWAVETAILLDAKHGVLGIRGRFLYNKRLGILEFCEFGINRIGEISRILFPWAKSSVGA